MTAYGKKVRDFLLMLKAEQDMNRAENRFAPENGLLEALEEGIYCVEAVYPGIEPKVGRRPENRMPVSFVQNRLKVLRNCYCTALYGHIKCIHTDEFCRMLCEAIRCVEVIGTGVPEPPTISSEDLR